MDLRELKKEVHSLSDIKEELDNFQKHWIKPIRSNTNTHLPFIKNLSKEAKAEINEHLAKLATTFENIKSNQHLGEQLQRYSRYLIELKLNSIRGHYKNSTLITNTMLNDDVLKLSQTIEQIKAFDAEIKNLQGSYEQVNEVIHKHISLDETLFFMDLPHKMYLYNLVKTAQDQRKIVRQIGKNFVEMVKDNHLKHKIGEQR